MYMVNQRVENLKKHLDVLVKYNWIYDFQVTELFSSRLFENKFPHSVGRAYENKTKNIISNVNQSNLI
jgi:hypothetical protein